MKTSSPPNTKHPKYDANILGGRFSIGAMRMRLLLGEASLKNHDMGNEGPNDKLRPFSVRTAVKKCRKFKDAPQPWV